MTNQDLKFTFDLFAKDHGAEKAAATLKELTGTTDPLAVSEDKIDTAFAVLTSQLKVGQRSSARRRYSTHARLAEIGKKVFGAR